MINSIYKAFVEGILNYALRNSSFQRWVNQNCNVKCGLNLTRSPYNTTLNYLFDEYRFNDIRKDDIVLDIGANVGGFALFMSKNVKRVYAVEPVVTETLYKNIELNGAKNVIVINTALGNEINWETIRKVNGNSLSEILKMCDEQIDFLKCDCEGGEWIIKPNELKGIRRIEMEVHNMYGTHNLLDYLKIFDDAGFIYDYELFGETSMLVHASRGTL